MKIRGFKGVLPEVAADVFIADDARVIGAVTLAEGASVWYGAVLRGDVAPIRIGRRSNIQDLTMVHATTDLSTTTLGDEVTVGHRVILHGCTIADRVLVGMGSIVLDLAEVGSDVIIGAGSLVPPRAKLESGWLYVGSPVKRVRPLRDADREMIRVGWQSYVALSRDHA